MFFQSSTFGYCRTTYTPKPQPVPNGFYLTKVRDYTSCVHKPPMAFVFNNFRPMETAASVSVVCLYR